MVRNDVEQIHLGSASGEACGAMALLSRKWFGALSTKLACRVRANRDTVSVAPALWISRASSAAVTMAYYKLVDSTRPAAVTSARCFAVFIFAQPANG
jgi:hypothetical protein